MFGPPKPCMRRFVQCDEQGLPVLSEEEEILHTLAKISVTFTKESTPIIGILYVTSSRFVWLQEGGEQAYDFDVRYIALHAISRDPLSYEKPCLYCQFDQEEDECDDEDEPTEVYFIPEDESEVQRLFDIFSEAALNNPDEDDEEQEEEEGGGMFSNGFIYNVDEVQAGAQSDRLNQWESVFQLPGQNESTEINEQNGHKEETEGSEDVL